VFSVAAAAVTMTQSRQKSCAEFAADVSSNKGGDLPSPAPTARPLPYGARLKLLASGDPLSRRGGGHGGAFARRAFVAAAPAGDQDGDIVEAGTE
jgi:hypothetical protein